jgi:hypothetical protein
MADYADGMVQQWTVYVLIVILEHIVKFLQVYVWFSNVHRVKTKFDSLVPCATTPCLNGGTCELVATDTYGCACPAEFTGTQCETYTLGRMIVLEI